MCGASWPVSFCGLSLKGKAIPGRLGTRLLLKNINKTVCHIAESAKKQSLKRILSHINAPKQVLTGYVLNVKTIQELRANV